MPLNQKTYILTLFCADQPGIVAAVTTELARLGANISESNQFWDRATGGFFMRICFTILDAIQLDEIQEELGGTIRHFDLKIRLADRDMKPRIIIMVSKFDHAMLHLLYQISAGWLNAEVAAIVSNHEAVRLEAEHRKIPFYFMPITKDNKIEQESYLEDVFSEMRAELIVLARYMQVLSDDFSSNYYGNIINIHHSFLPSFKGAKPYHQAHERGVKLIGATAHYVTPDLDEGPIIEQETERVTHSMSADDLVAVGRDIESRVLARAVKLHVEQRVMLNGNKTVVFY